MPKIKKANKVITIPQNQVEYMITKGWVLEAKHSTAPTTVAPVPAPKPVKPTGETP